MNEIKATHDEHGTYWTESALSVIDETLPKMRYGTNSEPRWFTDPINLVRKYPTGFTEHSLDLLQTYLEKFILPLKLTGERVSGGYILMYISGEEVIETGTMADQINFVFRLVRDELQKLWLTEPVGRTQAVQLTAERDLSEQVREVLATRVPLKTDIDEHVDHFWAVTEFFKKTHRVKSIQMLGFAASHPLTSSKLHNPRFRLELAPVTASAQPLWMDSNFPNLKVLENGFGPLR